MRIRVWSGHRDRGEVGFRHEEGARGEGMHYVNEGPHKYRSANMCASVFNNNNKNDII